MQSVVFKGPFQVAIEERPVPKIESPSDAIVKVHYTALCGSELHVYRGHQPSGPGFIMGHEFMGEIYETGSAMRNFKKGDHAIAAFTTSCGNCFYCNRSMSSRCIESKLFGSPVLDGGHAEFVRVPNADATLAPVPDGIDKAKLVFMADIFPTGYFAAYNAFKGIPQEEIESSTVVLLGCGPVGLFALANAQSYKPKNLIAVDKVDSRLEKAKDFGAEAWNIKDEEALRERVKKLTDSRGADIVIEVVGHADALRAGFDILRPFGRLSSVGVHNEAVPWSGFEAYSKNLTMETGRCPARSIFPNALKSFREYQDRFDFMAADIRPLSEAPKR
ncbi:hypothetical protein N7478_001351 [Penicillium angulare]|uniref:uncharacterized protein n=1 Tax=Penicillium angulare TaxID=116970 RepID=UPI0025422E4E|nr:uncharacterized protein N7478_001351 [Penicillium angulare]KAJ5292100.1 hypothetical protein N7478_001351 [Penicillium angulare]